MSGNWKKALGGKKYMGAVLTDLSKTFDCLNHKLLIAKHQAYGFGHEALILFIIIYLIAHRGQRWNHLF